MSNQPSVSDLMRQSRDTAETNFNCAVRIIDKKFGEGYARENPGLIGDFMKTAANDFSTTMRTQQSEALTGVFRRFTDNLTNAVLFFTGEIFPNLSREISSMFGVMANAISGLRAVCEDCLAFISRKRK